MPSSSASVHDDAEQLALDEPPLDVAPLLRRVAGAVRARAASPSPCRRGRRPCGGSAPPPCGSSRSRSCAGRAARATASSRAASPSAARAQPELRVEQLAGSRARPCARRAARRRRRSRSRSTPSERVRELARVRDRRRREHELRLGAVDAREPPQPPEDVARRASRRRRGRRAPRRRRRSGGCAARRAHRSWRGSTPTWSMSGFVRMRFAHLRICQRCSCRRVAVVDRRTHARHGELAERARLVLRERLRRIEVERAVLRLARERVEHGQVEGERLARRGAGRDDQVPAALRGLPGLGLMRVELARCPAARAPRARSGAGRRAAARRAARAAARSSGRRAPRPGGGQPTSRIETKRQLRAVGRAQAHVAVVPGRRDRPRDELGAGRDQASRRRVAVVDLERDAHRAGHAAADLDPVDRRRLAPR